MFAALILIWLYRGRGGCRQAFITGFYTGVIFSLSLAQVSFHECLFLFFYKRIAFIQSTSKSFQIEQFYEIIIDVKIAMFEEFKCQINKQNLQKTRQLHLWKQRQDSQSEDSLSDYQLQERQDNFKMLMTDEDSLKNNFTTPPTKLKKLQADLQLSYQKIKILEQTHKKQKKIIEENYLHQIAAQQAIIQRFKLEVNMAERDSKKMESLRKQSREALKLKEEAEQKRDQLNEQLKLLQISYKSLQNQLYCQRNKHSIEKLKPQTNQNIQSLKNQITILQKDIAKERQSLETLSQKLQYCRKENEQLKRQINRYQAEKSLLLSEKQSEIIKMGQQLKQLQSQNKNLEESLMGNLNQVTHMLFKNIEKHQSPFPFKYQHEQSLNLQDETTVRSDHKQLRKYRPSWEDPETQGSQTHQKCFERESRVTNKLKEANHKIVQLLKQKLQLRRALGFF